MPINEDAVQLAAISEEVPTELISELIAADPLNLAHTAVDTLGALQGRVYAALGSQSSRADQIVGSMSGASRALMDALAYYEGVREHLDTALAAAGQARLELLEASQHHSE